jgi:CRP/FNR family transcriptional regulator/CRP/FNR family cyclic AMP-dependent transcriptional regulator
MTGDTASHLRKVYLFEGLDSESLDILARHSRRRKFPARTTLFHQEDAGQTLYIVVAGYVDIQTATAEGETVHIAQRIAGEHFGELSLLDGKPRSADAVTGTQPCELVMIDREPFLRVMEQHPIIAQNVMVSLAERLRTSTSNTTAQQKLDVLGRLAAFLLESARTLGTREANGTQRVALGMTQQEIASRIGASRETVTRALGRLQKMGAVERKEGGDFVIRDARRLERLCNV